MKMSVIRGLCLLGAFAVAPVLYAQTDPVDVARSAFLALDRHDWPTIVGATHPEWMTRFRNKEVALLVDWAQSRDAVPRAKSQGLSAYGYSSGDSILPAALARVSGVRVAVFPGSPTIGALAAL